MDTDIRRFVWMVWLPVAVWGQGYRMAQDVGLGEPPPKLIVMEGGEVQAAVCPEQGGELSSLRVKFRGQWVEMLHLARDYRPVKGWRGKAPFLWPATGRTAPNGYRWRGQFYPMPMHGFAQNMAWKVESSAADAKGAIVRVSLADTPETRKMYPFGFRIEAEYRLAGRNLSITYLVRAAKGNSEAMFFSAGNHITFRAPLVAGGKAEAMTFYTPGKLEVEKSPERLPTGKTLPFAMKGPAPLWETGVSRVVSVSGYEGETYAVVRDPGGLGVRLSHKASSIPPQPIVLFNVWGSREESCFSPEPWVGLQNSLNLQKGVVRLDPGGTWRWEIRLEPHLH